MDRGKRVLGRGSGGRANPGGKPFKRPYRLFNMQQDRDESENLIKQHPSVAERLEAAVKRIRSSGDSRP
jgi:hypothetical protein